MLRIIRCEKIIFLFIFVCVFDCFGQSSTVIVNQAPTKNIFFYERTKYLYPNRKYHHYLQSEVGFKTDTINVLNNSPSVLIFQESTETTIPIILFPDDTLKVSIDFLGKLVFGGTREKEWRIMKNLVSSQSFIEPYLFNRTFKIWRDVQNNLDLIRKNEMDLIKEFKEKSILSEKYIAYLEKERNYQWMSSLLIHRNKSFKDIPLPPQVTSMKNGLMKDTLNYSSIFRMPALYSLIQAECSCYSNNIFPNPQEFTVLFDYICERYSGMLRSQLLLNILYEQVVITQNYVGNESFYEEFLNKFYQLCTDEDYVNFIKGFLKK